MDGQLVSAVMQATLVMVVSVVCAALLAAAVLGTMALLRKHSGVVVIGSGIAVGLGLMWLLLVAVKVMDIR